MQTPTPEIKLRLGNQRYRFMLERCMKRRKLRSLNATMIELIKADDLAHKAKLKEQKGKRK